MLSEFDSWFLEEHSFGSALVRDDAFRTNDVAWQKSLAVKSDSPTCVQSLGPTLIGEPTLITL